MFGLSPPLPPSIPPSLIFVYLLTRLVREAQRPRPRPLQGGGLFLLRLICSARVRVRVCGLRAVIRAVIRNYIDFGFRIPFLCSDCACAAPQISRPRLVPTTSVAFVVSREGISQAARIPQERPITVQRALTLRRLRDEFNKYAFGLVSSAHEFAWTQSLSIT